jgi:hypothetical protein
VRILPVPRGTVTRDEQLALVRQHTADRKPEEGGREGEEGGRERDRGWVSGKVVEAGIVAEGERVS